MFDTVAQLSESGTDFVIVTLVKVLASAPQDVGAKCVVTSEGLVAGTVGGGKVEARCIEYAKDILKSNKYFEPQIEKWNLQTDIGMTCGGVCHFLFEHFPKSSWKVALFGAGHVSQALTRTLKNLKCDLTVIDHRKEWLEKLPKVKTIQSANAKEVISQFDENTFFISMTKGHAADVPFLIEIYKQFPNAPYIGAIGSKAKRNAISKDLREAGVDENFINRLHIPLGLPIGNNQPYEIAISICAQLLEVRDKLT